MKMPSMNEDSVNNVAKYCLATQGVIENKQGTYRRFVFLEPLSVQNKKFFNNFCLHFIVNSVGHFWSQQERPLGGAPAVSEKQD